MSLAKKLNFRLLAQFFLLLVNLFFFIWIELSNVSKFAQVVGWMLEEDHTRETWGSIGFDQLKCFERRVE